MVAAMTRQFTGISRRSPILRIFLSSKKRQQTDLHLRRNVADFVKKQRAAFGGFDQAFLITNSVGKGPPNMPEQLTFEQACRCGSAIHRHQRVVTPWPGLVNEPGDALFAHAAFAKDEHINIAGCYAFDEVVQLQHGGASHPPHPGLEVRDVRFGSCRDRRRNRMNRRILEDLYGRAAVRSRPLKGLVKYSTAPALIALTASGMVP